MSWGSRVLEFAGSGVQGFRDLGLKRCKGAGFRPQRVHIH